MELNKIVDTIQEKLGKEESGKIADDLANILIIEEANSKTIKEKDEQLTKMKKDKEMLLRSFSDELFVNLSDNNENLLNDYLVSCINSSFKIGHSNNNIQMHDLVIDYGIEKNEVERLKIMYKYLLMLSGNKNEK